jgi:hypothetical protein
MYSGNKKFTYKIMFFIVLPKGFLKINCIEVIKVFI